MTDFFAELEQQLHRAARRQIRFGTFASPPAPHAKAVLAVTVAAACIAVAVAVVPSLAGLLRSDPERAAEPPAGSISCADPAPPAVVARQFGVFRRPPAARDTLASEQRRTLARELADGEYPFYAAKVWVNESRFAGRHGATDFWLVPALVMATCATADKLEPGICMVFLSDGFGAEPPYSCMSVKEIRAGENVFDSSGFPLPGPASRTQFRRTVVTPLPDDWHAALLLPGRDPVRANVKNNLAIVSATVDQEDQSRYKFVVAESEAGIAEAKQRADTEGYGERFTFPRRNRSKENSPDDDLPMACRGLRSGTIAAVTRKFELLRGRARDYDGRGTLGGGSLAFNTGVIAMHMEAARRVRGTGSEYVVLPVAFGKRRCDPDEETPGVCIAIATTDTAKSRCAPLRSIAARGLVAAPDHRPTAEAIVAVLVPDGVTAVELVGGQRLRVAGNLAEARVERDEADDVRVKRLVRK